MFRIPSSTYAPPTVPSSSTPSRCAECRRRKIKCDRKIPCGNCVKTGKQDMCPDGDMGTKKERFVLRRIDLAISDKISRVAFFKTPNLPSKLEGLVARVDTLEAAFHGNASNPTSTLFQGMEDRYVYLLDADGFLSCLQCWTYSVRLSGAGLWYYQIQANTSNRGRRRRRRGRR